MNPATFRRLEELRAKTDKEFGKLVQKLLAIAFLETDAESLVERSIQGIDLEVTIAGTRYAFEVKTCEEDSLTLGKKDLAGLERELESGAEAYIAVLGGGLLDEWLMVHYTAGEIPPSKKLSTFELRPYRNRDLERRVASAFEEAVEKHAATAIYDRQKGLDRVLEGYPARALA